MREYGALASFMAAQRADRHSQTGDGAQAQFWKDVMRAVEACTDSVSLRVH